MTHTIHQFSERPCDCGIVTKCGISYMMHVAVRILFLSGVQNIEIFLVEHIYEKKVALNIKSNICLV